MEADLPIDDHVVIPGGELCFSASRSGGPGGQHVNKTSSKVTLSWNVTASGSLSEEQKTLAISNLGSRISADGDVKVSAEDNRSQHRNREVARTRLAEMIRAALVIPKERIPTRASAGVNRRRLSEKRKRSSTKALRRKPAREE